MRLAARLLLGEIKDADYFAHMDAEYRGLRLEVARPGWSSRWRLAVRVVLLTIGLILAFAVVSLLIATAFVVGPDPL